jgi:hypothetical protein
LGCGLSRVNLSLRQIARYYPDPTMVGNSKQLAGAGVEANGLRVDFSRLSNLSECTASFLPKKNLDGLLLS